MDGPLGGKIKKISIVKGGKNACTRSRVSIDFLDTRLHKPDLAYTVRANTLTMKCCKMN
jgi:hypothetical protein